MYLKSIEIKGFKSFYEKTTINFEKGIISIVGPNGSGKSNILDAIRWVLGEQSIKELRGEKMEDVIFQGSQTRNPLSLCEVTITINNEDHLLNIDFEEIEIKRKSYRDGESKFYINQKKCRLKDIRELLLDTGIGKEGYSVISQGKIDEIVNSSNMEKRKLLEEASGISKFRFKKEEGEKNLTKSKENLNRINDIFFEIERQIKPLEIQMEKAKKYLLLKDELKICEINKYLKENQNFQILIEESKEEINKEKENLKEKETLLNNSNSILENLKEEINKEKENKENIIKNISKNKEDILLLENEIDLKKENTKSILEKKNILKNEIMENSKEISTLTLKTKEILESNKLKYKEVENLKKKLDVLKQNNKEKIEIYKETSLKVKSSENSLMEKEREFSKCSERLSFLKTNMNSFAEKLKEQRENLKNLNIKLKTYNEDFSKEKNKILLYQKEKETLLEKENKINNLINENTQKLLKNSKNINQGNLDLEKLNSKNSILINMEDNMEGFSKASKRLLKEKKFTSIENIVANIIKVKKGYEKAIETLLGGKLENIIIKNSKDAYELIDFLKENKLGRLTFLPLSEIKPQYLKYNDLGILATDSVTYNEKYENIVRNLLGKMVIVDNFQDGLTISKKYNHSFKISTKDGEIFNVGGSITGGASTFSKEIFSRRTTIEQNNLKILNLKKLLKDLNESKNNFEEKNKKLSQELKTLKDQLEILEQNIVNTNLKLTSIEEKIKNLNLKINEISEEENLISSYENDAKETYENDSLKLTNLNTEIEDLKLLIVNYENFIEKENVNIENIKEEINSLQSRKNIRELEINSSTKDINYFKSKISDFEEKNNNFNFEIQSMEKNILENENFLSLGKENLINLSKTLEEKNNLLLNSNLYLKNLETKLKSETQTKNSIEKTLLEAKVNFSKKETQLSKITYKVELLNESLLDQYKLDFKEAIKYKKENADTSKENILNLKKEISNLGNINLNSIEEFNIVNQRYLQYKVQKEDLEESIKKIEFVIKKLEETMIEDFKTTFNEINENFNRIFKILFNGGFAKLILVDENDVLNSEIAIKISPPGKKLKSISMLSGGEKALSAIALLFSIIHKKPVPFCILDEVDAPLDDINISRYITYLNSLKENTQFITITHRRITMENSDYIYGVTMEEKGITKVISLKLDEINDYVED